MAEKTALSSGNGTVAPGQNARVYVGVIEAALDVLNVRLLALLALLGGVGMFIYATLYPDWTRLYIVGTYAVAVLWPQVWAMIKRP